MLEGTENMIEDDTLSIEIDFQSDPGPSKSGKTHKIDANDKSLVLRST